MNPGQGLLHSLLPLAWRKPMAVAMARKQPSHIEILQLFEGADLLLEIPPAVLLGAHQHLLLGVPPEVITTKQHAAGLT